MTLLRIDTTNRYKGFLVGEDKCRVSGSNQTWYSSYDLKVAEKANPAEPVTYSTVHLDEAKFSSLTLVVTLLQQIEAILSPARVS